MKQHLIALFACTALFAAACSESKPPVATASAAPAARVEPKPAVAVEPPAPEKGSVGAPGEEVKTDAQQVAAFEQKVLK